MDREIIIEAFLDLLDGVVTITEIISLTGLSQQRCCEIYDIYLKLLKEKEFY